MSKKAVYAQVLEPFFVKGLSNGNFSTTLPNPDKTLKNFTMIYLDHGALQLEWEHENVIKTFIIPQSNIKGVLLEDRLVNAKNNNTSKE
jgi:hypothetical protein